VGCGDSGARDLLGPGREFFWKIFLKSFLENIFGAGKILEIIWDCDCKSGKVFTGKFLETFCGIFTVPEKFSMKIILPVQVGERTGVFYFGNFLVFLQHS
jgi:hypothetical protein